MALDDGAGIEVPCASFRPNFGFLVALSLMLPQVWTLQAPFGAHTSPGFAVKASYTKSLTQLCHNSPRSLFARRNTAGVPSAHGHRAEPRAITRDITSRDAVVVHRQAVTGHSNVFGSPVQALVALSTLYHGPVCILYHIFISTLIPVHAAMPDGLEIFAI